MILVNVLTTIWKREVDSVRRQVCARTAALPHVMGEDAAVDLEAGAPLPLKDTGPSYAALRSSGYADPGGGPGRGLPPGDGPREGGVAANHGPRHPRGQVLLLQPRGTRRPGGPAPGSHNLAGGTFPPPCRRHRRWGFQRLRVQRVTGLVLSRRLEAGRSALRRLPHLSTYEPRERAIGTLVTPLPLHGGVVASVMDLDLRGVKTAVVRAPWGATRVSRAKEIVFMVLSKGHSVSPVMHTRYERLLWLAGGPTAGGHPGLHPAHLGLAHDNYPPLKTQTCALCCLFCVLFLCLRFPCVACTVIGGDE